MISVDFFRNKENKLVRFRLSGHAGYAESGADIVCAAATTAAMTAVNGLTDIAAIRLTPEVSPGYIDCALPEGLSERERRDADVLLESMVLTFLNLAEQYAAYISIQEQ
ncbi:MAG: ribosomal-processing cysteine protease Prp [Ruminococcaceae bacterium]|nr:ribosomal-processing cysteine protease Prp [Oscillospiraceae bacterium]